MKIFHGPVNIGGIGYYLSSYQKSLGHVSDFCVFGSNFFLKNHDHLIDGADNASASIRLLRRVRFFAKALRKYELFNFYFGKTLLPYGIDLPILRFFNKKIVMVYCGSDARLVEIERQRNPYWAVVGMELEGTLDDVRYDFQKKIMMLYQGFLCHKVLAPRNLYDHVVRYVNKNKIVSDIWVHNLSSSSIADADDSNSYSNKQKVDVAKRKLKVIHVPSSPKVKGSSFFRAAIKKLQHKGYDFDYRELQNVSHTKVLQEIKDADIVLDQLLLGGFGSLSVEAMAAGKPVICYMIDSVKSEFYPDCPIINANINNVEAPLERLLNNVELRSDLGTLGEEFVQKYIDYHKLNKKMMHLYREILGA